MARKQKPEDIVDMKVCLTEALRARLEKRRSSNDRSINGEIVYRLGASLREEGVALANQLEEQQKEFQTKNLKEASRDCV